MLKPPYAPRAKMAYASDIRPMPDIPGGFALCRERQACRYGAKCTFAHSEEECRAWNAQKFGGKQGIIINTCSMPSI